jgi:dihydroxyacetone kinase-like predicted kinase
MDEVLSQMLGAMEITERELATIYFGADTSEEDAIDLAGRIKRHNPDIEVEIIPGGQAHYFFILGVE